MAHEEKGGDWQVALSLADIPESGLAEVVIGNDIVVIAHDGATIHAVQGLCPHQMARLVDGSLSDGWLQCPRHKAAFFLVDGTCGPGWQLLALRRYATKILDGYVWLPAPLQPMD